MKCHIPSCSRKATVILSYINRSYCDAHFMELIERRVRKDLRTKKKIDITKSYVLLDDKSKETEAAVFFLERIFKKRLKFRRDTKPKGKVIVATNLDREINRGVECYLKNRKFPKHAKGACVLLLDSVLDEELVCIARILKIKAKREPVHPLIEAVDKNHHIKFSLKKSLDYMIKCETGR